MWSIKLAAVQILGCTCRDLNSLTNTLLQCWLPTSSVTANNHFRQQEDLETGRVSSASQPEGRVTYSNVSSDKCLFHLLSKLPSDGHTSAPSQPIWHFISRNDSKFYSLSNLDLPYCNRSMMLCVLFGATRKKMHCTCSSFWTLISWQIFLLLLLLVSWPYIEDSYSDTVVKKISLKMSYNLSLPIQWLLLHCNCWQFPSTSFA